MQTVHSGLGTRLQMRNGMRTSNALNRTERQPHKKEGRGAVSHVWCLTLLLCLQSCVELAAPWSLQLRPLSDADRRPAKVCGIDAARRLKQEAYGRHPSAETRTQLRDCSEHEITVKELASTPATHLLLIRVRSTQPICRLTCTCKQVVLCSGRGA